MKLHHLAIGVGLACFLAPSLLLARPMTLDESRCFELGEAVYQATTPQGWDSPEPYQEAEEMSERVFIACLDESYLNCEEDYSSADDDIYGFENFVCR